MNKEQEEVLEEVRQEIVRNHEKLSELGVPFMTVVDIKHLDEESSIFLGAENISIGPIVAALYRIIRASGDSVTSASTRIIAMMNSLDSMENENLGDEEE